MATTIKVYVPEAYALDANGHQLDKLVVKHAKTQVDMQPQLSQFVDKWTSQSESVTNREEFAVA
jgi:hypothetical protein